MKTSAFDFEIKKQNNSGLEKRIGTFFEKLEKEQTSEAFAHLLDNSTIGRKKNNVADLVKETEETLKKFGRVKEYEKIKMDKIGSRIVRLIYFSYSDDFPLKWEIYFYSGKSSGLQLQGKTIPCLGNFQHQNSKKRFSHKPVLGHLKRPRDLLDQ